MKDVIKYTYIPQLEERSFNFDYVKVRLEEQIKLHEQNSWELSYIIRGSGMRVIGDMVEPFLKGEVILIPPNIPHCWSFDNRDTDAEDTIENITITFPNLLLERCRVAFPELKCAVDRLESHTEAFAFTGNTLDRLQKTMSEMILQDESQRLLSLITLLYHISLSNDSVSVGKSHGTIDKRSARMQRILLYMMNNYQNPITIADMAQLVGLEKSSFCVFFKKMTGKTFFSYLTDFRIGASCQMLVKTSMTVAEVCFASGFRDVPYFNRTFKRIKKLTPTAFRVHTFSNNAKH